MLWQQRGDLVGLPLPRYADRTKKREVVTIYEVHQRPAPHARAVYNFRWTPQTDPFGVRHETIDYPGVPVDHDTVHKNYGVLQLSLIHI